jgi:hypothetical protein
MSLIMSGIGRIEMNRLSPLKVISDSKFIGHEISRKTPEKEYLSIVILPLG